MRVSMLMCVWAHTFVWVYNHLCVGYLRSCSCLKEHTCSRVYTSEAVLQTPCLWACIPWNMFMHMCEYILLQDHGCNVINEIKPRQLMASHNSSTCAILLTIIFLHSSTNVGNKLINSKQWNMQRCWAILRGQSRQTRCKEESGSTCHTDNR